MTHQRLDPKERQKAIMDAAIDLANLIGFEKLRRENVARQAGVSASLVSRHWGTMTKLRRGIMREAIQREELKIIAQGIVLRDKQALKVSANLKERALASL